MSASELPPFSRTEILGVLPTGWRIGADGDWDPSRKSWRLPVLDPARLRWDLTVDAAEIERHGRFEALRRGVDRLVRDRFR